MKTYLLNGLEVEDFVVEGIDTKDYPDFCDAYIESASVLENGTWRDATENELDQLNDDSDLVYEEVLNYLF